MKAIINSQPMKRVIGLSLALLLGVGIYLVLSGTGKALFRVTEMVPLGSYSLSVRDYGKGEPTVIIEAGLGCRKEGYYELQYEIAKKTRVIAYDHAGIGESTVSPNPRTLPYYVKELKDLLKHKNILPPYILIGHSLGGHIIRYFTYEYPDEVAGLIFLDHPHEDWFRHVRKTWSAEEQKQYFKRWNPEITSPDQVTLIEATLYDNNNDLIRGKKIPANIPVLMFTGRNLFHFRKDEAGIAEDTKWWIDAQASLLDGVKHARQVVDIDFGHFPHELKPEKVKKEVNQFIDAIMEHRFDS
jgi:pimeloyl-ACP methyl ester carboxylesterase